MHAYIHTYIHINIRTLMWDIYIYTHSITYVYTYSITFVYTYDANHAVAAHILVVSLITNLHMFLAFGVTNTWLEITDRLLSDFI